MVSKKQWRKCSERAQREADAAEECAHKAEAAAWARAANREAREFSLDALAQIEQRRVVQMHVGGSLVVLEKEPGFALYEKDARGRRGRVSGFTVASRQRMMESVSELAQKALPLFAHLTYPAWWPGDWQAWKKHLDTFAKRLFRKWPGASFLWKLEPQERGAPHFHLLIWGVSFIEKEWLARVWFEVVGSNDEKHLHAGTRIEAAESCDGVLAYCSKQYMGKGLCLPDGWEHVGRFWGICGRKNLPRARKVEVRILKNQAVRFRRLLRRGLRVRAVAALRKYQAKGGVLHHTEGRRLVAALRPAAGGRQLGRVALFTSSVVCWARALDWAGNCDIVNRLPDGRWSQRNPF